MDDLLPEFIAETRETLEALSGEIVAWEADPTDRARLDAIFRFVHTVKGSCGFLDLPRLARLSHAAEDVLSAVRDGNRLPDVALVNAVLGIVDRIGELVEAIDAGHSLDDSSEDLLIAALAEDARPVTQTVTAANPLQRGNTRTVRLSVDLLDRMMSGMSEMVLARNELARRMRAADIDAHVDASLDRLSLTVADMRDTVTRTRMQRIDALFGALPRMVRDTAGSLDRSVALTIEGADVELDREMIELMRDPLVHVIRNSIDHGIEAPAERRAAGKPEVGRLTVAARQSGNQILIEIADDGRGIDTGRLVAKAKALGLHGDAELDAMSEAQRCDLVFHPGLSSRDVVTATSGRGVGMDVVRSNVEQIGGRVVLANRAGRGLTITIHVPLTLSIISTIIVSCGTQRFALSRQAVEEIVMIRGDQVRIDEIGGASVATVRGRRLPLVRLGALLGIDAHDCRTLAIVSTREGDYALGVDAVLDTEELVVKPAAPIVMHTGVYAGQTLPDSGLPMLLLDGSGIAATAGLSFTTHDDDEEVAPVVVETGMRALMFDDLDGQRRAMALGVVDRIETVAAGAVRTAGGRLRLTAGDTLLPLHAIGSLDGRSEITILRLTDGETEVGYAIAEPIEIVDLPTGIATASRAGVAGVALVAGEPVELLDAHALFATEEPMVVGRPLCLLQDETGWMETFLKPMLEASGYRCVASPDPDDLPAVTLAMGGAPTLGTAARVVRLRRERDEAHDGTIYRYDRAGIAAAMADQMARIG